MLYDLETNAKNIGLRLNEEKAKLMRQSRKPRNRLGQNITLHEHNFEVVGEFIYLGSSITQENEETSEVKRRITAANRTYFSLFPILKSRSVHRKTKIRIYKTIVRTVVAYGSESWTILSRTAEMLDCFERKILRKIFGPVMDGGAWRIRYNHELYQLYQEPKLSTHKNSSAAMGGACPTHAIN